MVDLSFYKGKKVLITGHTGFKGSWLTKILLDAGAIITGYSLEPQKESLFNLLGLDKKIYKHIIADIRSLDTLMMVFEESSPEIVFHLAAQPIVRLSYEKPVYTYEINVMGTANVLECVRRTSSVKSFLNVTTDKVYKNNEWEWGYRECDVLDGYDPYSNSKSNSELVTSSYKKSFLNDLDVRVSTARAGNVIGGGDFAIDRIVPDCVRSAIAGEDIFVRNPNSVRPFQHVLEPLFAYLLIAQKQYEDKVYVDNYNVGPDDSDCVTVREIATLFCNSWGDGLKWTTKTNFGPHEANFLKLDCSKIRSKLDWKPTWDISKAIEKTVEFAKVYHENGDITKCVENQINEFIMEGNKNV